MPRLTRDTGIVPTGSEQKSQIGAVRQIELVDRTPGRNMICFGSDQKRGHPDIRQGKRPAAHAVTPGKQIIIQKEPAQVLTMHAIRHAGRIGVPGHQIIQRLALAHQIMTDHPRPDQVMRPQQLKCACHLPVIEIALIPHQIIQIIELAVIDKQSQLTCLGKIRLRGQQGH